MGTVSSSAKYDREDCDTRPQATRLHPSSSTTMSTTTPGHTCPVCVKLARTKCTSSSSMNAADHPIPQTPAIIKSPSLAVSSSISSVTLSPILGPSAFTLDHQSTTTSLTLTDDLKIVASAPSPIHDVPQTASSTAAVPSLQMTETKIYGEQIQCDDDGWFRRWKIVISTHAGICKCPPHVWQLETISDGPGATPSLSSCHGMSGRSYQIRCHFADGSGDLIVSNHAIAAALSVDKDSVISNNNKTTTTTAVASAILPSSFAKRIPVADTTSSCPAVQVTDSLISICDVRLSVTGSWKFAPGASSCKAGIVDCFTHRPAIDSEAAFFISILPRT